MSTGSAVARSAGILIVYTNNNADKVLTGTLGGATRRHGLPLRTTTETCKRRGSVVGSVSLMVLTPRVSDVHNGLRGVYSRGSVGLLAAANGRCVRLAHSTSGTVEFITRGAR